MARLAALYVLQENFSEAATCLEQARSIQEKSLGKAHPELAATLEAYAAVLEKTTPPDAERAKDMRRQAKDIRAKHKEAELAP